MHRLGSYCEDSSFLSFNGNVSSQQNLNFSTRVYECTDVESSVVSFEYPYKKNIFSDVFSAPIDVAPDLYRSFLAQEEERKIPAAESALKSDHPSFDISRIKREDIDSNVAFELASPAGRWSLSSERSGVRIPHLF